jgi:hypothetical protein
MDERLEPLPELALRLLEAERQPLEPPPEVRERMAARMSTLFTGGAVAAASLAGGDAAAHLATSDGASHVATTGSVAKSALAFTIKSKLAVAAVAFGLGAGAGASVHAVATRPAPPAPSMSATVSAARELPPTAATFVEAPAVPSAASASASVSSQTASATAIAPPLGSTGLKRERSLIDTARMAILRGDKAAALRALDSHAREFPNGQHASERDALARRARALDAASSP